jgi:hypothetical protein
VSQFATAVALRTYLDTSKATGRYTTENLDFMLEVASNTLERATGRIITASGSNTTKTFTTHGRAVITIPDLRTVASSTLGGSTLTENESVWLIPSAQANDIYTGVQVRPFRGPATGGRWYLHYREWFDRNLDSPLFGASGDRSLPNDLVITGLWGWSSVPAQWKLATLALAGYYLKHSDALLAGAGATPDEGLLDFSEFPSEAQRLIHDWQLGEQVVLA